MGLDVEYVEKINFILDIKIIFVTLSKAIKKENVAEDTNVNEGNLAEIRSKKLKI